MAPLGSVVRRLVAGPMLCFADVALSSEAGRRLADGGYNFDMSLPPTRPVTDEAFYNEDFRVPVFRECGGQGKIEYKCEMGCTCEQADDNVYSKRCMPPKGMDKCDSKTAKHRLAKAENEEAKLEKNLREAFERKKDAAATVAKLAKEAVEAKKAAEIARKELDDIEAASGRDEKVSVNQVVMEAHDQRTVLIPQKTKEAWTKAAKVIAEAQAKIDAEQAVVDAARKEHDRVTKAAQDEFEKEVGAAQTEVDVLEEKRAKLVKQIEENVEKDTREEASAFQKAKEKEDEALAMAKEFQGKYDAKEEIMEGLHAHADKLQGKIDWWSSALSGIEDDA